MRKIIFVIALSCIFFMCKNEKSQTADTPAGQVTEQTAPVNTGGSSLPAVTPPNFRETPFLLKDYWVFEFYILPSNRIKGNTNIGRWYNFNDNGTFESGQWENKTASGTWTLQKDLDKVILRLDSGIDIEDAEYFIQSNQEGDEMSWVATKTYPEIKGVMLKTINLMTIPTRKQFGLE